MSTQTNEEKLQIIRESLPGLRERSRERIEKNLKEAEGISDPEERGIKLSSIMKDMSETLAQEFEWTLDELGPRKD